MAIFNAQIFSTYKVKGFTLIELMVTTVIFATTIGIALPNLNQFIAANRVDNEISLIHRMLFVARNTALNENKAVTLCPLNNKNICENNWQKPISVFTDSNNNKTFEPINGERLISIKSSIKQGDILKYGNTRIGLTYASTGHLSGWGQNATFSYCPKNYPDESRAIVVSIIGRIYQSSYNEKKQIEQTRSGKKVTCV